MVINTERKINSSNEGGSSRDMSWSFILSFTTCKNNVYSGHPVSTTVRNFFINSVALWLPWRRFNKHFAERPSETGWANVFFSSAVSPAFRSSLHFHIPDRDCVFPKHTTGSETQNHDGNMTKCWPSEALSSLSKYTVHPSPHVLERSDLKQFWLLFLRCFSCNLDLKKCQKMDRWMEFFITNKVFPDFVIIVRPAVTIARNWSQNVTFPFGLLPSLMSTQDPSKKCCWSFDKQERKENKSPSSESH